jgi:hypothetical protein
MITTSGYHSMEGKACIRFGFTVILPHDILKKKKQIALMRGQQGNRIIYPCSDKGLESGRDTEE